MHSNQYLFKRVQVRMKFRAVLHARHELLRRGDLDFAGRHDERQAVAQRVDEVPEVDALAQGQLEPARRDRIPLPAPPQAPLKILAGLVGRGVWHLATRSDRL